MIQFTVTINNNENIGEMNKEKADKITEIIQALVSSGSLTGVRGGKTIIHFDSDGVFQGIELDYYPWRRRNPQR